MKRRLAALSIASLMVLLAGCGQVQDAAHSAASDAASKVATAAADQVKGQVCALVEDGLVSIKDKESLGGLVSAAQTAGVPSDITTPLRQIAETGDPVPAESVTALKEACSA
ncbi:hypothetical protein [Pseudarthrobacter sp. N5]|uniref:hypothetical protein n=1 Tax=Pseudarthrobacter sp. N5 TaxID=3418416 RepID=UPI003CE749BD